MRKLGIVLAILLSGCAISKREDLENYTRLNKPLAGHAIKWSDFYQRSGELASAAKLPEAALFGFRTQVELAQRRENGQLSNDDYEYRRQYIDSIIATSVQQQDDMDRMERMSFASALMQANSVRWNTTAAAAQANTQKQSPSYVGYGAIQTQSINGGLKYCTYSNGVITTIAATSVCAVGSN